MISEIEADITGKKKEKKLENRKVICHQKVYCLIITKLKQIIPKYNPIMKNLFLFPSDGIEEKEPLETEEITEVVEPVVNNQSIESDTNIQSISSDDNESFLFPTNEKEEVVSNLDKLEYGWDKNQ